MKKPTDEALYAKYPELLKQFKGSPRETCLCWGLIPGPGWAELVENMCAELQEYRRKASPELELTQIKEKFGYLRVYFGGSTNTEQLEGAQAIISRYEVLSGRTCMRCGAPGKMRNKGWLRCHCSKCEKAYQKERE